MVRSLSPAEGDDILLPVGSAGLSGGGERGITWQRATGLSAGSEQADEESLRHSDLLPNNMTGILRDLVANTDIFLCCNVLRMLQAPGHILRHRSDLQINGMSLQWSCFSKTVESAHPPSCSPTDRPAEIIRGAYFSQRVKRADAGRDFVIRERSEDDDDESWRITSFVFRPFLDVVKLESSFRSYIPSAIICYTTLESRQLRDSIDFVFYRQYHRHSRQRKNTESTHVYLYFSLPGSTVGPLEEYHPHIPWRARSFYSTTLSTRARSPRYSSTRCFAILYNT